MRHNSEKETGYIVQIQLKEFHSELKHQYFVVCKVGIFVGISIQMPTNI